ncbi:hypothetical protein M3Y99_00400400 [Aphelenchoides fujianensis]|nr:hypothetical protein M3Y99_00400400 [Aphelenchoides fujianensis]
MRPGFLSLSSFSTVEAVVMMEDQVGTDVQGLREFLPPLFPATRGSSAASGSVGRHSRPPSPDGELLRRKSTFERPIPISTFEAVFRTPGKPFAKYGDVIALAEERNSSEYREYVMDYDQLRRFRHDAQCYDKLVVSSFPSSYPIPARCSFRPRARAEGSRRPPDWPTLTRSPPPSTLFTPAFYSALWAHVERIGWVSDGLLTFRNYVHVRRLLYYSNYKKGRRFLFDVIDNDVDGAIGHRDLVYFHRSLCEEYKKLDPREPLLPGRRKKRSPRGSTRSLRTSRRTSSGRLPTVPPSRSTASHSRTSRTTSSVPISCWR